jgi:chemotaxis protein methyltransferase CheR
MGISDSEFSQIIKVIREKSSYDFSDYSDKSLNRRLVKILMDFRITVSELLFCLETKPDFLETAVKKITVNTTEMFRDPAVWIDMQHSIIPIFANNDVINIWHAGCSTGQEVYSMIILLSELGLLEKTNIYASDLNTDALEKAKNGVYKYRFNLNYLDNFEKVIRPLRNNQSLAKEELYDRYLEIDLLSDTLRIKPDLLKKPIFAKHNLVNEKCVFDTRFDLILCRNVIIYFNINLQNRVFKLVYENLVKNGILLLGAHESIHGEFLTKYVKHDYHYRKVEA